MKLKKYSLLIIIIFTITLGGCSINKAVNVKNKLTDQNSVLDATDGEFKVADKVDNKATETKELTVNPPLKQLTYKDKYIVYLKEECSSDNKGIKSACLFSIKIKDTEKGWETFIVNKTRYQTSLKWIKENTLEYTENSDNGNSNENKSVNLDYILQDVNKRLYTLSRQFSNINLASIRVINHYYIKDEKDVYFERDKTNDPFVQVEGADAVSFEAISEFSSLAKDTKSVYFNGDKIDFLAKNFEFINPKYFKSDTGVGYLGYNGGDDYYVKVNNTADVKTLAAINNDFNDYIRDSKYVFYQGKVIQGADVGTFMCLSPTHCKDNNTVYYWGTVIEGADPETFKVIDVYYGYDKNNKYFEEKIVE